MEQDYINELIARLRQHHINTYGFYLQVHRAHWDVTGMSFGPLHELFGEIVEVLLQHVDDIAERQRQFKMFPTITLADLASSKYGPEVLPLPAEELVLTVGNNLEAWIEDVRELVSFTNPTSDFATTNWLSDVIQNTEKFLWKVRANIEVVESVENDEQD